MGHMKEEMIEEGMKEEESPPMIMNIVIILQRGQGTPGMKAMLLINMNIFLFSHYIVYLLRIIWIVGWFIAVPLITSPDIRRFSLIW